MIKEFPSKAEIDRVLSLRRQHRDTVGNELEEMIWRLSLIEGSYFQARDGQKILSDMGKDAFTGLAVVFGEALTCALYIREALTGTKGPDYGTSGEE